MTFEQAMAKCHEFLGTWRAGTKCTREFPSCFCGWRSSDGSWQSHDIPMPPANDAMLAQIFRKWQECDVKARLTVESAFYEVEFWLPIPRQEYLHESNRAWAWVGMGQSKNNPLEAAIFACAEWLVAKEQQK